MQSELILEPDNREVATVPQTEPPASDLRHLMMTLPVEQQNVMLAEYRERRDNMRRWLMSQLEEGKHYGYPPGCRQSDAPKKQWQSQPSLYAAGADLICDLLGIRTEFTADIEAWQQLGSKPGTFVICCRLYSRAGGGVLIGEGRGARKEGQKGGDANNALKMAQKSAKVDAVLNSYGLRDMFTQDLENPPQPLHDNPEANPDAPRAEPRGKRTKATTAISEQQLKAVKAAWLSKLTSHDGNPETLKKRFAEFVGKACKRTFDPAILAAWTVDDYCRCCRELNIEAEGLE